MILVYSPPPPPLPRPLDNKLKCRFCLFVFRVRNVPSIYSVILSGRAVFPPADSCVQNRCGRSFDQASYNSWGR